MDITDITHYKSTVDTYLISHLSVQKKRAINTYESDLIERLVPFVTSGKSIRGCLTVFSYTLFQQGSIDSVVPTAAAMELFHSGFLIHDDIMDRDAVRRGMPAMHAQYGHSAATAHYGTSIAINAGDYCFFCGYQLLAKQNNLSNALAEIISGEFTRVTSAQMADVSGSSQTTEFSLDDILSLYRYKTARYTFSLPLMVGATLANAPEVYIRKLELVGETLGILFQIRDDELNLIGDSRQTGKPVGSDRISGKQTVALSLLSKEFPTVDLASLTEAKMSVLYHKSKSAQKVEAYKAEYFDKTSQRIQALAIPDTKKAALHALAQFVKTREN